MSVMLKGRVLAASQEEAEERALDAVVFDDAEDEKLVERMEDVREVLTGKRCGV